MVPIISKQNMSKTQEIAEIKRKLQQNSHELRICNESLTTTKNIKEQVKNLVSDINTIRKEHTKQSVRHPNTF